MNHLHESVSIIPSGMVIRFKFTLSSTLTTHLHLHPHTNTNTQKTHYFHQVMKPPFSVLAVFMFSNALIFKYILSGDKKGLPLQ